ncbi:MAG: hypothetical protein WC810_02950 [Janthinobacterium sp.]|jgi:hypothetical protein
MTIGEIVSVGGVALSIIGLIYKFSYDHDKKVNRVYARFDEFKKCSDEKYTSKEIFDLVYARVSNDLEVIKCDIKTLLGQKNDKCG